MKRKHILYSFPLLVVTCLTSCGKKGTTHPAEDYFLDVPYKEDFTILQMTDIHLGMEDNLQYHFDFMDLTIDEAKPDFLMLTGDLFTFANENVMYSLFNFIDSHKIPWGVTFGNHDEQVYFSISKMTSTLSNFSEYCKFIDYMDDDVYGNANYVINLKEGDKTKFEMFILDSNRYRYGEHIGYDYIHKDQIEWYERMVKHSNEVNKRTVPSIAFFHIPFEEYQIAYDLAKSGSSEARLAFGENRESVSSPKENSGFFDKIVELGSTKATFVGHDHVNHSLVNYKGVDLVYGLHSTDRVYHDEDLMGGLAITIKSDDSLEYHSYYHTYAEVNIK